MKQRRHSGFTPTPNFIRSLVRNFEDWLDTILYLPVQVWRRREQRSQYENWCRGFTLIEVTIVLGLIGVIAAFGVALSFSSLSNTTVTQERDLFVTLLLRGTRAAAVANIKEISHGVKIDNGNHKYILFEGESYTANPSSYREIPYTSEVIDITNTGGDTIVFQQLSGNVIAGDGVITVSNGSAMQEITIRESGQIDW